MCNLDYDVAEVYSETYPVARKAHRCSECFRSIAVGEKYRRHFGVWNGVANTFKTCAHCCIPMEWLQIECGGFMHGNVMEEILEHAMERKSMKLYRMYVGINRHWQKYQSNKLMRIRDE